MELPYCLELGWSLIGAVVLRHWSLWGRGQESCWWADLFGPLLRLSWIGSSQMRVSLLIELR